LSQLPLLLKREHEYPWFMEEINDVTLERCSRPTEEELAPLEIPYRPIAEGNGWYAHYLYFPGGVPALKRLTHGDHADIWYRALPDAG